MAYLYVWSPNDDSWGHASLLLEISQVYISWWPKDDKSKYKKKKKKVDAKDELPDSYDEDVDDYNGREATHKFYINENKIKANTVEEWWRRTKGRGGYHLFGRNCCDVVYAALEVGGCYDWVHPGVKVVSTPRHMIRYGQALENAEEKDGNPFRGFVIR